MNEFSQSVMDVITQHFPDLLNTENKETPYLELVIPAKEEVAIGGMVIQVSEENEIWLRNFHPYSAQSIENAEELIDVMKGIFADEIFWAMGYKEEEWIDTMLINNIEDAAMVNGAMYQILSWSGELDKTVFEE